MRLEYRPHLPHIDGVGIILEVPQQFVDVVQVHVVMVHLVVALWITTNIAIGIHLRAPSLLSSGQILCRILRGMGNHRLDARHLTLGVGIEMTDSPVVPSEHIA